MKSYLVEQFRFYKSTRIRKVDEGKTPTGNYLRVVGELVEDSMPTYTNIV